MTYAAETSVPVDRSQREIEDLVRKRGAVGFMRGELEGRAVVAFQLKDRRVQFELPLPRAEEFSHVERRGRKVKAAPHQVEQLVGQAERARWRALALAIKAKLVSVETGVESFEEAFLAQIVVPGHGRFGNWAIPAIAEAYGSGKLPPLLPAGGGQ